MKNTKFALFTVLILSFVITISALLGGCNKTPSDSDDDKNQGENTVIYTDSYLFENGSSEYKIILPENASEAEKYAAQELNGIFRNSTGYSLQTVESGETSGKFISIGNTEAFKSIGVNLKDNDMGRGGFVLKTIGDNLYINSDTQSGKINGVYSFAEKNLGYMYYASDEIKYTSFDRVRLIKFDTVVKPSFDGRNTHSYYTVSNPQNASRLKANSVFNSWSESFGEASIWSSLHDMSNVFQLLYVKDYYHEHKDWFYVSPTYADKSAEFKSMSDSDFYVIAQKYSQICYTKGYYDDTDGGMFDTYCNNLIEYIKSEPDAELFMLGMGDNDLVCNCETCKRDIDKYKVSGITMRFTNKVARRVNEWLKNESGTPDRKIYFVIFAYITAMEPPVIYVDRQVQPIDESVVADSNVCVRIAPLVNSNFYWGLDDKEHNTYMSNSIDGWKQITSNFTIWDYRVYYHYLFVPYPIWNVAKYNLELYKSMNVIDVYHQGYAETPTPFGKLDDYVRSRLLFDLNEDVNEITDDFIDNYYKDASEYIHEYWDMLKYHYEMYIVPAGYSGSVYTDILVKKFWPLETLIKIKDIFDNAYKAIENLPDERKAVVKQRVDFESRFYRYALLELYSDRFTKNELSVMIDEFKTANAVEPISRYAVREMTEDKIEEWETLIR